MQHSPILVAGYVAPPIHQFRHPPQPTTPQWRHAPPLLDASQQSEAERKQRLRQLFGDDFKDAADTELSRVSPLSQLNENIKPAATPMLDDDDDALAGRRVKDKRSDFEQLIDVGMRFEGLWTLIDGVRKGGLDGSIVPGRVCIARRDFPTKYIVCDQAYEVKEIYYQGMRGAEVERVPVGSIDARPPEGCDGYVMYLKLFSAEYHTEPVTVRPEEVGLVSMGTEIVDALKIGVPILCFWLTVISAFLAYGEASR